VKEYGSLHLALDSHLGIALGHELHGYGSSRSAVGLVDDLAIAQIETVLACDLVDALRIADEDWLDNATCAGLRYRL
jgi:hypothetical protein